MIGVWTAVVYPFPFHGHGVNTGLLTALFIKAKFCFSASYGVTHKNQASLTREAPVEFRSVAQPCPTVCNPMDHSIPGLPVHRQLPKFTQTHVLWVGDAIQPPHPLLSASPLAFNLSQHQGNDAFPMSQLFAWRGQSIGVSASTSVLPMNTQDWSPLGWISLQSKGLSRDFSNTTV